MGKPAARVTDMHTCPMVTPGVPPVPHVGGPIMPTGVLTVLIGGLPAATVGCMCMCVGPPDTIVFGSLGVFIGGRPAARMGDMTSHGGVIVGGLPTVLIGDIMPGLLPMLLPCDILKKLEKEPTTEEEKKEQEKLKKDLENCVNQKLGDMSPQQRADTLAALNQYQKTSDALDKAYISKAMYDGSTPLGYKRVEGAELESKFGLKDSYMKDDKSGFEAAIFESTTGKEPKYTAGFKGTDFTSGADWKTNGAQGIGMQTEQYDRAMIIGDQMQDAVGPNGFDTTGHSLGGGLASAASAMTGAKGTTFNAAGLHNSTTAREGLSDAARAANMKNVDAYYNSADPLNFAQDNRGMLPAVLGGVGGMLGGGLGKAIGALGGAGLLASGALPQAYGNRIELPSKDGLLGNLNVGKQHSMDNIINQLKDKQKQDLENLKKQFQC